MYKRSLIVVILLLTSFAVMYPVLENDPVDEAATEQVQIDPVRQVSYRELMVELEKRAAKFPGEAGILVRDLKTHQTIGINPAKLFPSASLVKIPIMAAVFQAQQEGRLTLGDKLPVLRRHKVHSSSRLYFVRSGSKIPIHQLLERMITESDNTATNVLVDALGFGYLNQKFLEFGLRNTDLRRGIMDLKWRDAGIENYTTAEDMAYLLEKIYRGKLVSSIASAQMMEILKRQKVNDRIPRGLPENLVIAHKTGLLRDTVSDVGVVFTPEGDFIICVLTADFRSFSSAKRFIGTVAACAYARCYRPSL
ncbi:MAG: serine hydrolase [Endomicrobiales bacterium]